MTTSKFSETQIACILRQAEEGLAFDELCRTAGISEATYCSRRKNFGGLLPSGTRWLKELEDENSNLKKPVADVSLNKAMLQAVIRGKL